MRVLVVGATGRVGRRVVDQLLDAGHEVSGLARDPSVLPATVHTVAGDVRDPVVVREALTAGDGGPVDAVVSALGTPPDEAADDTLSAGVRTLVEAMADLGIERFVGVAAAGVLDAPGGGLRLDAEGFPPFLHGVAEQHRAVYETLTESSLQWTLVCPPNMPDGDATGQARVETDRLPDGGTQVTTGNVAAFVVRTLADGTPLGRVGIAGPA
ncbi:NAD(P)H-binding protein [Haloarcula sp. 1CSR25-25]|uniref:NAD(P)-dependent oxidoreductase n=1 Tax=Haloarcula sp. 1CSR25-25 TaxID=2862545 RepID=UPI00289513D2|nr:NAD(P)H-binding protein [Haloarcula sp. 1CSR25-25]MDT3436082.1 NAD(P)H-binding protein [Haloarcula sp. 1CSR25-25]